MKPKRSGILLGLMANVAFGWGMYHVMGFGGSCGAQSTPCPDDTGPHFFALQLGLVASIVAMFLGGGGLVFLSTFTAVGIASILRGLNGGAGPEGDTTFAFAFGGVFLLPLLLAVVFIPFARRQARSAERLASEGRKATGTVTAVHDTGVTVNNDPRVRLTLSIQPEDGSAAFDGEKTMIVSRLGIPRVGDRYPVFYDPAQPSRFELDTGSAATTDLAAATAPAQEWVSELGKRNDLRLSGALTDEEFNRSNDRLLASGPTPALPGGVAP